MHNALKWSVSRVSLVAAVLAIGLLVVTVRPVSVAFAATCVGDCDSSNEVTVNELITLVNIALGGATVAACPNGIPEGANVDIGLIIQGVNNALNGCPITGPAVCGNGTVGPDEECDDGGVCIGGSTAGTACTKDADCPGSGVCFDGPKANIGCSADAECPGSKCVHCRPVGGDGCAANCTRESDIHVNLVPGVAGDDELSIVQGTSGLVVHGDILTIPLPFPANGSVTLTVGKELNGKVPAVLKTSLVHYPRIPVQLLACACLRGAEFKTCGGTLSAADGTLSKDCTVNASVCAGLSPCAPVFGAGNSGAGTIGCTALDGVNMTVTQDSATRPAPAPVRELTGTGDPGSMVLHTATSLGFVIGACTGEGTDYGQDGEFCTSDDPPSSFGTILAAPQVTGTATATIINGNQVPETTIGPYSATGAPLSCAGLQSGSAAGANLAGAFTMLDAETIGDIVVTTNFVAQ